MSHGPARGLHARRHQDGRLQARRHHAEGRPARRLPGLPHGHHRRERAAKWQLTREDQDRSPSPRRTRPRRPRRPASSRTRSLRSRIKTRKGDMVVDRTSTSAPAPRSTRSRKLKPAFSKDGTVTAGNASGINDGAAAIVLMTGRGGAEARSHAPRPHRLLGDRRRRSGHHGHGSDPVLAQGAREGRLEGVRPRPRGGQRGVRGAGLAVNKDMGWDAGDRERQRRRDRHRPSRSAPPARASWSRSCTRCRSATPRRASRPSASAAAWASPCAWSADRRLGARPIRRRKLHGSGSPGRSIRRADVKAHDEGSRRN